MSHEGIKITNLRTEIMTLVNSDPVKYDPNNNGKIDEGFELSQLLSEYQCTAADLISNSKGSMWTLAEQQNIREQGEEMSKSSRENFSWIGSSVTLLGIGAGAYTLKKGIKNTTEQLKVQKFIDIEKVVADGSYTPQGRPAADIFSSSGRYAYMKRPVSNSIHHSTSYRTLQNLADSPFATGSVAQIDNGKFMGLRYWKPGDPQFVKQGTKVVEEYKTVPKRVFNTKILKRGGFAALTTVVCGLLIDNLGSYFARKKAQDIAKLDIKAAQTADGERIMQERQKHEEEIRQREAAMKQEELEYRERMHKATQGVDTKLQTAEQRARNLNRELKKAHEIISSNEMTPDAE